MPDSDVKLNFTISVLSLFALKRFLRGKVALENLDQECLESAPVLRPLREVSRRSVTKFRKELHMFVVSTYNIAYAVDNVMFNKTLHVCP